MRVIDFLQPALITAELQATSKAGVLGELAELLARQQPLVEAATLKKVLEEREQLASTAIGDGIAIPHGKLDVVGQLVGALGRSRAGIEFDSIDGKPTHLVFMLVAPSNSTGVHLKALARLSRLFRDAEFRQRLLVAEDASAMYRIIADEDSKC